MVPILSLPLLADYFSWFGIQSQSQTLSSNCPAVWYIFKIMHLSFYGQVRNTAAEASSVFGAGTAAGLPEWLKWVNYKGRCHCRYFYFLDHG